MDIEQLRSTWHGPRRVSVDRSELHSLEHSVSHALEAKQKIRFIDGTIKEPTNPQEFKRWKPIDSMTFDSFRGQILNLDPMPIANKAYNMDLQLERQREVNMTYGASNSGVTPSESLEVAMIAKIRKNDGERRRESKEEKYSKYCEHCHMNGHVKESCFKLQGYPDWYKELKKRNGTGKKGQIVATTVAESPLDVEDANNNDQGNQMSILSILVKELSKVMKGNTNEHVNFAQLGNFAVILRPEIMLTNVLYIPDFKYNLISAHKTDKILAKGKVEGNLYILHCVGSEKENSSISYCNSVALANTCVWHNRLRSFGCLCYIANTVPHKDKFDTKAYKSVFLGYASGCKAYKVYDAENKKMHISRDIVFYEENFPFQEKTRIDEAIVSPSYPCNTEVDPGVFEQPENNI
ncbi:Retrovirus-related Pol polyprotein from transposon RE1 [Senna tora]|uniref:Retrovirus-related Pol polyprotein from transposon RE1 n=1 Tax=Senna tora TaxID=362788 RepID=A0A834XAD4_9FABA|nr:Retrovirus-related Pol polyprotein from transposon RE1 [Senna tora]